MVSCPAMKKNKYWKLRLRKNGNIFYMLRHTSDGKGTFTKQPGILDKLNFEVQIMTPKPSRVGLLNYFSALSN